MSSRELLVIGEYRDASLERLGSELRRLSVDHETVLLGLPDSETDIVLEADWFGLRQGAVEISSDKIVDDTLVIYRRCWNNETPSVLSSEIDPLDRAFAEREWSASVQALLYAFEFDLPLSIDWVNRPSLHPVARNKFYLFARGRHFGFTLPRTRVATQIAVPDSDTARVICKSVNADERIDANRYFGTVDITREANAAIGERASCPQLLQERMSGEELRIYYLLGHVLAFQLATGMPGSPVDSRDRLGAPGIIRQVDCPQAVEVCCRDYVRSMGLHFCVFDVMLNGGAPYLLDVNVDGSWHAYESEALEVTRQLAAVIADNVRNS